MEEGDWRRDSTCCVFFVKLCQKVYVIYIAIGRLVCCLVVLCGVCIFHTVQLMMNKHDNY